MNILTKKKEKEKEKQSLLQLLKKCLKILS